MATDRQVDAISIGIGANLQQLREQLRQANSLIAAAPLGDRTVTIRIQTQLAGDIQRDVDTAIGKLAAISEKARPPIHPELKVNRADTRAFAKAIKDEITGNGGIKVPISADLRTAKALNKSIRDAIGVVNVQLTWSWKDGPPPSEFNATVNGTGGGGGGGTPSGGTRRPSPRRDGGGHETATGATQEHAPAPHTEPVAGGVITRPARPARPSRARASSTATAAPTTGGVNELPGYLLQRGTAESEPVGRTAFSGTRTSPQGRIFERRLREDAKLRAQAEAVGITFSGSTVTVPVAKKGQKPTDAQKFWDEHTAEPDLLKTDWHSFLTATSPSADPTRATPEERAAMAPFWRGIGSTDIGAGFAQLEEAQQALASGHTVPPETMDKLLKIRNKLVGGLNMTSPALKTAWAQKNEDYWDLARNVLGVSPATLGVVSAVDSFNGGFMSLSEQVAFARTRDKITEPRITGMPKPKPGTPGKSARGTTAPVGDPAFLDPNYIPPAVDESRYATDQSLAGKPTMAEVQAGIDRLQNAKEAHRKMFGRNKLRGNESVEQIEAMVAKGLPGRAGGGPVQGPLQRRIAERRAYLTGEHHPELFKGDSGETQVVGSRGPEVFFPPEHGKIEPFVPMWMRRNMAKDLTGRAGGGPVDPFAPNYRPGAYNEEGQYRFRAFTPEERAMRQAFNAALPPEFRRQYSSRSAYISTQVAADTAAAGGPLSQAAQEHAAPEYTPVGPGQINIQNIEDILAKLTPAQRASAQIGARQATLEARLQGVELRGVSAARLSTLAQRSTPLGVAQFTSTTFGRGESVEKQKLSQFYLGEAAANTNLAKAQRQVILEDEERIATIKALGPLVSNSSQEIDALREHQGKAAEAEGLFNDETKRNIGLAKAASGEISSAGKIVKNFTAQITGAITGTLLYGGAFTGIQTAIALGGEGVKRFIDLQSGFYLTTTEVTGALKDQTEKLNGNAKAAVQTTAAQAGMSGAIAASTTDILAQRAAGEAGNDQLKTQLDLIRSANQVNAQNGGFFAANGIDRSTLLGTGGLDFGGSFNVGGQGSTLEQVVGGLAGFAPGTNFPGGDIGKSAFNVLPGGPAVAQALIGQPDTANAVAALKNFNADILKSGNTQQFKPGATNTQQQETQAAIYELSQAVPAASDELAKFSQELAASGTAIVDANGNVVKSAGDLAITLQNIQKGALTPTSSGLLDANQRQRQAQLGQIAAELTHSLQTLIPIQQALQYFGNRPLPFGAGIVPGIGGQTGPLNQVGTVPGQGNAGLAVAVSAFGKYANIAGPALAAVKADAEEGRQQILSQLAKAQTVLPASQQTFVNRLGSIGGPFGGAFQGFANNLQGSLTQGQSPTALFNQYEAIGKQVQNLQEGIVSEQAALALTQYNHQLFLTERAYKDALGLAGKLGSANSDNLGTLQRETFELQKQSEALSLQLQQRQINFQVAVAGFTAPGLTSEERAAREKEALIEANYAQKQLNISKKEFGVGVQIFDVSAVRQVQDVGIALSDLKRQFITQNDVNARLQAIAALQAHAANLATKINAYLSTEEQKFQQAVSETTQIAAVTGDAFGVVLSQAAHAWNVFTTDAVAASRSIITSLGGGTSGGGGGGGHHLQAPGYFGTANTPTTFTVGEAGAETVAILRNARQMTIGGGGDGGSRGGGNTIVVNITGNHVRSDSDLRELKAFILRTLNEKAALTGLRNGIFG